MPYSILPQRGVIRLAGDDAPMFLQGLVSNDVRPVGEGRAVYAAMLSPQGKFLHDFFLVPQDGAILIDCEKTRMDDLLQRLKMYRLRSKVEIDALPENIGVVAMWSSSSFGLTEGSFSIARDPLVKPKDDGKLFTDPRLPQLGRRMITDVQAIEMLGIKKTDSDAYDRMRLEIGVPDGSRDMIIGKSLLLEFGFEDLHGVDFTKGCYVGQEVTARSKYRGQLKKFIYQVRGNETLPEMGTPVMLDGAIAGELRSHAGTIGLAQLKVAEVERAQNYNNKGEGGMNFVCGNVALKVTLAEWVANPPKALAIDE